MLHDRKRSLIFMHNLCGGPIPAGIYLWLPKPARLTYFQLNLTYHKMFGLEGEGVVSFKIVNFDLIFFSVGILSSIDELIL